MLDEIKPPKDAPAALVAELIALRGQANLGLGQLQQAKDDFIEAQHLNADSATVQLGLARIALVERDYDRAIPYVERALEIAPKSVDAWLVKGELARLRGDLTGARGRFCASPGCCSRQRSGPPGQGHRSNRSGTV